MNKLFELTEYRYAANLWQSNAGSPKKLNSFIANLERIQRSKNGSTPCLTPV
jgi:hypothetical protein